MWLVPPKAGMEHLLPGAQRVSCAAEGLGRVQVGVLAMEQQMFPQHWAALPPQSTFLPLLAVGMVQKAQTIHLSTQSCWDGSLCILRHFFGLPRALGMISSFKGNGERACVLSLVCGC